MPRKEKIFINMKKQIRKSSNGMSMFKRLSLGNMICAWVGILVSIILVLLMFTTKLRSRVPQPIAYFIVAAAISYVIMGIAQAVEGRYYGDVFGQMTRRNTTIMLTVFLSVFAFGVVVAMGGSIIFQQGRGQEACEYTGFGLAALAWLGHAITSSLVVAKTK